jgi:hypothetical protein
MSEHLKHLPNVLSNSLTKREPSMLRDALADRVELPEALEIAGKIIRSYPSGARAAGDGYIGALASVLGSYPASVVRKAHLCPGGVPAECSTMPSPAQLIKWCEENTAPLRRRYEREERVTVQLNERAEREAKKQTPRGMAMTQAWLDRSDPAAAQLSGQEARHARDLRLRAAARAKLIAEFGQEAFDAVPDAR